MKNILIFHGNPNRDSYTEHLANAYKEGAESKGHTAEIVHISDLEFDPILHQGYRVIQQLEPDLVMLQNKIKNADHIVFIYPNWWCSMPAAMKGMFDRMWLPGFAFNFDKATGKCIRHLKGKTARVIIECGTSSPMKTWWEYGDFTNELAHGILNFAGIKTHVSAFGPTSKASDRVKNKWAEKVKKLGTKGV